jgi:cytochrome c-type biogenesis protein CcmH
MSLFKILIFLSLFIWSVFAYSAIESLTFQTEAQSATYHTLVEELRCLVCQNNNLADSNAPLAKDLRHKVYNMVVEGQSREDVIDFMIARYGDFVLYKPRFEGLKIILWLLPFMLLILGLLLLMRFVYQQKKQASPIPEDNHHRAQQLLSDNERI